MNVIDLNNELSYVKFISLGNNLEIHYGNEIQELPSAHCTKDGRDYAQRQKSERMAG